MLCSFTKIITYLISKDEYLSRHRNLLSKRLVHESSISLDAERNLASKIAEAMGSGPVRSILEMLADVATSEDQKKQFSQKKPDNPIKPLTCSDTDWPGLIPNPKAILPGEMELFTKEFEQFYRQLFVSRELTWILSEGRGEVQARFAEKRYVLDVKTYQMTILLRFNESSEYTFRKLKELTGINEDLLNEYLVIFTNQVPVLRRGDGSKKVS